MRAGEKKVEERVATIGKDINGWSVAAVFGDRAFFNGDWLLRAAAAKVGIYGNDAVEAMYPLAKHAADGSALDGAKQRYTVAFAKDRYPPVNAFWSITMSDDIRRAETRPTHTPWKKGKLTGQEPPLKLREVLAIRIGQSVPAGAADAEAAASLRIGRQDAKADHASSSACATSSSKSSRSSSPAEILTSPSLIMCSFRSSRV